VPGTFLKDSLMIDAGFWIQKWEKNDIAGFHGSEANPALVKYFKDLSVAEGSRIFLPLCGKTLDIAWLLSKGYRVAGAELSALAIKQLFEGLGVTPKITEVGKLKCHSAQNIDIFEGDIFELSSGALGQVNAVYDRAALVALPQDVRKRYTAHLMKTTGNAPQLLVSYEYDQKLMDGPPFSVSNDEVRNHYKSIYDLNLMESSDVPGGLKGKCAATENVWILKNKQ
jgi:thiopurine S-methyltransferase